MAATYTTAVDEIFAQARAKLGRGSLNAGASIGCAATTLIGYEIDVRWQGVELASTPDATKYWARVSIQGVSEAQVSLADEVTGPAKRRYEPKGLIFVQVFAPMVADGMDKGRKLAMIARDAFRGQQTASGVVFRNVRINELPNDGKSYRFNVVAEYEYDDIA